MMENKTKIDLKNTSIFITGAAGFIGSNLAKRILTTVEGAKVVGLDNMNHYYDVRLKEARFRLVTLHRFVRSSTVTTSSSARSSCARARHSTTTCIRAALLSVPTWRMLGW